MRVNSVNPPKCSSGHPARAELDLRLCCSRLLVHVVFACLCLFS